MDSNKPSVNSESSIDKHEYSEYITPRAIDNVCDTRFERIRRYRNEAPR